MNANEVPTGSDSNSRDGETTTVSVSPNGQATIPKRFREKLGIEAPGHVRFRETDDGTVVEGVPSVEEMKASRREPVMPKRTSLPASSSARSATGTSAGATGNESTGRRGA